MAKDRNYYDENLINDLGYYELAKIFSLDDEKINGAIYFAVMAVDSHIKNIQTNNFYTEDILFGDFFSFEYYDILKNRLPFLKSLTSVLNEYYLLLAKDSLDYKEVLYLATSLPKTLLSFYGKEISKNSLLNMLISFYRNYEETLKFYNKNISLAQLLVEFEEGTLC